MTAAEEAAPVYWRQMGEGDVPALLLHCSLGHSGAWAGVMARISGRLDATAMDAPGHGRSGDWDGSRDFHTQATEWAAALCPEGAVLIGHSLGATMALRLALSGAVRLSRLILIEPVLFAAARGTDAHAGEAALQEAVAADLEAGDREAATRRFAGRWSAAPWETLPEAQRAAMCDRIHLIPAAGPALAGDNSGMLAPGRLEALAVPTLLIEGAASPPVIGAILDVLAARLPDTRRVVIPGAAHMAPVTHPGPVTDAIAGFLDG